MPKHTPAGYGVNGNPLTAVEVAFIVGISKFAAKNRNYFTKILTGQILFGAGIILLIASVVTQIGAVALLGLIITISGGIIWGNSKTVPVVFPDVVVLEHFSHALDGKPLLVSPPNLNTNSWKLKDVFPSYERHTPISGEEELVIFREPGNNSKRSVKTLADFRNHLSEYASKLENQTEVEILTNFLSPQQSQLLDSVVFSNQNMEWAFRDYLSPPGSYDNGLMAQNVLSLDKLTSIAGKNKSILQEYGEKFEIDFDGYRNWRGKLVNLATKNTNRVMESVELSYSELDLSSLEASDLLLNSVDNKIQENSRKIEFEAQQKLSELESKMEEMQAAINERKDEISRSINSQTQIVSNLRHHYQSAMNELSSIPNQVSIQIPYTVVSGGGGSIGQAGGRISSVYSSVKYQSVYFPNPDYASKEQSVRMLSTLSNIETEKLSSLKSELSSTDDLISEKRQKINEEQSKQKKEYADRMEKERAELSKHAIKVQNLHQDILDNPSQIDLRDLQRLVMKTWGRPAQIMERHLDSFLELNDKSNKVFADFGANYNKIISGIISGSPKSLSTNERLISHWVVEGENLSGMFKLNAPISIQFPKRIQPAGFDRESIFQNPASMQSFRTLRKKLNPASFSYALLHLSSTGNVDRILSNKLIRLSNKSVTKIMRWKNE